MTAFYLVPSAAKQLVAELDRARDYSCGSVPQDCRVLALPIAEAWYQICRQERQDQLIKLVTLCVNYYEVSRAEFL